MAIKKAFADVIAFLEENKDSKVKTILPAVLELCSAKSGGAGGEAKFIKNAAGVITHVFCYYHKMWEPVNPDGSVAEGDTTHVEYGKKTTSATGLNSMCKEGTSKWTSQQAVAKKANLALLTAVAKSELAPGDIPAAQEAIEAARAAVVARADGLGSTTKPE